VKVAGKAAGVSTITVTDGLGGSDTYVVTVSAGAAQTSAAKVVGSSSASFAGGASSDGGATFTDTFAAGDDVTIVGTINVEAAHQGLDGAIHVAVLSVTAEGSTLAYLDEDGNFAEWNPAAGLPGAYIVAEPLGSTYNVTVFSGELAAGTHRVALAYTTENGDLVYAPKAIVITVE
jgi:hypothetical protein